MIKKEQIQAIAKVLKLDATKLEAAIADQNEVELEIPQGLQGMIPTELEARDRNVKSTGYNEGVTAGKEMLVKELKTTHGITIDGKGADQFMSAYKAKVLEEAKITPNEQLKEKDTVITNLQNNIQALQAEKQRAEGQISEIRLNSNLFKQVPELGVTLEPEEVIGSMRSRGYSFEQDQNGAIIPKLNGQVIRDATTQNPLAPKDVISGYVTDRKWNKQEGDPAPAGRGGGNSKPVATGSITSLSQAQKAWEAEGKSANTAEFAAHVQKISKENQDFKMDE